MHILEVGKNKKRIGKKEIMQDPQRHGRHKRPQQHGDEAGREERPGDVLDFAHLKQYFVLKL